MSTLTRQKYAVLKPDNFKMIPLDCPVCKFFMLKDDDIQYYNEYACCKECAITWAEGPNKEKWKEGWRPADDPWLAMTAIMTMEEEGGATRYTARALHKSEVDSRKHEEMGFEDGWGTCIDQLGKIVEKLA